MTEQRRREEAQKQVQSDTDRRKSKTQQTREGSGLRHEARGTTTTLLLYKQLTVIIQQYQH